MSQFERFLFFGVMPATIGILLALVIIFSR